jgi:hypothetical protein
MGLREVYEYTATYEQLRNETRQVYADCNTLETGYIMQWDSNVAMDVNGWQSIMESALEFDAGEHNNFCTTEVAQFFYDAETIYHDELSIIPSRRQGVSCFIHAKHETLDYIRRFARKIGAKAVHANGDDLQLLWD